MFGKILEHGVAALIILPITACQQIVIVRAKVILVKFVAALTRAVYIVLHFMSQLQQQRLLLLLLLQVQAVRAHQPVQVKQLRLLLAPLQE
jgi:hypothetical protein